MQFLKIIGWFFFCVIFWTISWSLCFVIAYLMKPGFPVIWEIFKFVPFASAVGGAIFSTLVIRYLNRQHWQDFIVRNLIFWIVFWDILIPLVLSFIWWQPCSPGCDWLCLCSPADKPIIGVILPFVFLFWIMPSYFLVAPATIVPLGWLFQRLFGRLFRA